MTFPFSITFHLCINYLNSSFMAFSQLPPSNLTICLFHLSPVYSSYAFLLMSTLILQLDLLFIFKKPSNRSAPLSLWLLFPFGSYLHCTATSSKTHLSDISFVRDLISSRLSLLILSDSQHIYVCFMRMYQHSLHTSSLPWSLTLPGSTSPCPFSTEGSHPCRKATFFQKLWRLGSLGKSESQASLQCQGNKHAGLWPSMVRRIICIRPLLATTVQQLTHSSHITAFRKLNAECSILHWLQIFSTSFHQQVGLLYTLNLGWPGDLLWPME